jgi:hypothetical protein
MPRLDTLKKQALKALQNAPKLSNREKVCRIFSDYMPLDLEAYFPIGDLDGDSFLFLNLSQDGTEIHVHLSGLRGPVVPSEHEPIALWLYIDNDFIITVKEASEMLEEVV